MKTKIKPQVVRIENLIDWVDLIKSGKAFKLKIDASLEYPLLSDRFITSNVWTALYRSSKTNCYHIQWGTDDSLCQMTYETAKALALKALVDTDHLWQLDYIKPYTATFLEL